jgi:hypothetical protein
VALMKLRDRVLGLRKPSEDPAADKSSKDPAPDQLDVQHPVA